MLRSLWYLVVFVLAGVAVVGALAACAALYIGLSIGTGFYIGDWFGVRPSSPMMGAFVFASLAAYAGVFIGIGAWLDHEKERRAR